MFNTSRKLKATEIPYISAEFIEISGGNSTANSYFSKYFSSVLCDQGEGFSTSKNAYASDASYPQSPSRLPIRYEWQSMVFNNCKVLFSRDKVDIWGSAVYTSPQVTLSLESAPSSAPSRSQAVTDVKSVTSSAKKVCKRRHLSKRALHKNRKRATKKYKNCVSAYVKRRI